MSSKPSTSRAVATRKVDNLHSFLVNVANAVPTNVLIFAAIISVVILLIFILICVRLCIHGKRQQKLRLKTQNAIYGNLPIKNGASGTSHSQIDEPVPSEHSLNEKEIADLENICDEVLQDPLTSLPKKKSKGYRPIATTNEMSFSEMKDDQHDEKLERTQQLGDESFDDKKENEKTLSKGMEKLAALTSIRCKEAFACSLAGSKQGLEKTNQDCFYMNSNLLNGYVQFYLVCDGHGPDGHYVAQYCCKHLPSILFDVDLDDEKSESEYEQQQQQQEEEGRRENNEKHRKLWNLIQNPVDTIISAFKKLEEKLTGDEDSQIDFDTDYSGTTITCCLVMANRVYFANLGDSRCVLGYTASEMINDYKYMKHEMDQENDDDENEDDTPKVRRVLVAEAVTRDHEPGDAGENARIEQSAYGRVVLDSSGERRIVIQLDGKDNGESVQAISTSVSRSMGDGFAHRYGGVISTPQITQHDLHDDDMFIALATDGIWTIYGNAQDLVGFVEVDGVSQKAVDTMVKEARKIWRDDYDSYIDDITAVLVKIGPLHFED